MMISKPSTACALALRIARPPSRCRSKTGITKIADNSERWVVTDILYSRRRLRRRSSPFHHPELPSASRHEAPIGWFVASSLHGVAFNIER
jgi:hypothetical protein